MFYYRLTPEVRDKYQKNGDVVPGVLIFDEYSKSLLDGGVRAYAINWHLHRFNAKELILLSDEEVEEYNKKVSAKDLSDCLRAAVGGAHGNKKGASVCSFAFRLKAEVRVCEHQPCYASLGPTGATECVVWDNHTISLEKKETVRELYSWLVNDSPWLHCISSSWGVLSPQERTDRTINGPVPVNMEAPSNEVIGFAVAMRTISEHHWTIPTYLRLREMGASKAAAFMLAAFLKYDPDSKSWQYYANSNWHHYLSEGQSVAELCEFFKEGYFLEQRSLKKFNEARYSYVAGQIATEHGEEGLSMRNMISQHMEHTGAGWRRSSILTESGVKGVIKHVEGIWQNA